MKSLEMVNNKINNAKDMIIFYQLLIDKLDEKETAYKISKSNFFEYQEELKVLTQIKQDLEILEIIRKKIVDLKLLSMFFVALMTDEEILFSYNSNCSYEDEKLTMEELLKLKQWSEENENE